MVSASERIRVVNRVTVVSAGTNCILAIGKILVGLLGRSSALVADGVHSVSDIGTTLIAFVGIRMSTKESDEDHPYGHEKIEAALTKIVATLLFITAVYICIQSYHGVRTPADTPPDAITLWVALISLGMKELLFRYTMRGAKKIQSNAMRADAWHNRSDALSSLASFIGILGARFGVGVLDPIMGMAIGVYLAKLAIQIYIESFQELIDTAADKSVVRRIRGYIATTEGVGGIDSLKTRRHGNRIFVDVEISVDGTLSLFEAHHIAAEVHQGIEEVFQEVKHCMVHVNPREVHPREEHPPPVS
ncbi:cation diffusion facilitator family transporter [Chitinivibrio alkaliphilus]|uniref:Cation diffusion facilitator family transporter n=1 Tax=Chitinivibrio alkaliphilus ACht1 TaxID=1313304 RepID=U7D7I4_9BACT|nr:cation diffusion facilitator family transporter [Chitinivibrio alkaliphilus]ERP31062.1 cation diffusion facilitator family transporter [Chitinivibrio alkaliphilus ACht1]